MKYGCMILVTHVAGTRMISQGTDGISRGRLNQGVSLGENMLKHCLWGKNALDAAPKLLEEIKHWTTSPITVLRQRDWYELGHDVQGWRLGYKGLKFLVVRSGFCLWTPPPCAGDVAVEQLRISRSKRKRSTHCVIIPRLMTPLWLKPLYKVADLVFEIYPVHPFWEPNMHEPLIVAFVFPFISHRPWQLRSTLKMLAMGRKLCTVFKSPDMAGRNLLQQLLLEIKKLPTLQSSVVWRLLYFNQPPPFPHRLATDHSGGRGKKQRESSSDDTMKSKASKAQRFSRS